MTPSGAWVTTRLGVALESDPGLIGFDVAEAVGLALRRNPRRAHLLVSRLLGKHVPTDPRLVYGAGRLLGVLVADLLAGGPTPDRGAVAQGLLRRALAAGGRRGGPAAAHLLAYAESASAGGAPRRGDDSRRAGGAGRRRQVAVLGYAETATALGHAVADSLGAPYVHSTRRPVAGAACLAGFAEEHSHAQEHLLLPDHPEQFAGADVVVLVDDEFSTGRTVLNTLRSLHRGAGRGRRYVLASLVDVRSAADRDRLHAAARDLGAEIDVVSLATGRIRLPGDLPQTAARLMAEELGAGPPPGRADGPGLAGRAPAAVYRIRPDFWPADTRDGGRHGFSPGHQQALRTAMQRLASRVAVGIRGPEVLVLGFEELMYAPQLLAIELIAALGPEVSVRSSSTTRSPVFALDEPGYAVRTRLTFGSCDDPADGPGPRFAYNVVPSRSPQARRFDDIVLAVDGPADTPALTAGGGLLAALTAWCTRVHLVTLPSYRPTPR